MSKELAKAIYEAFGTSDSYTDSLPGALFSGLREVAKAITGHDPKYPQCRNTKESLCASINNTADAIRELADAVRSLKA